MLQFVRRKSETEVLKDKLAAAEDRIQRLCEGADKLNAALAAEHAAFDAQGQTTAAAEARAAHFDQFKNALSAIAAKAEASSANGADPTATLGEILTMAKDSLNPPPPRLSF